MQLASNYIITQHTMCGVAVSLGQAEFWRVVKAGCDHVFPRKQVSKGLEIQGIVLSLADHYRGRYIQITLVK